MNITFLGTSSGVPSLTRNVSSIALKLSQSSEVWLFDCGEGTQHQIMKSNIKSSQIKKIFITHMHGDHIYGLPGLLATLGLSGSSKGIEIYGPSELRSFINSALKSSFCKLSFPLHFVEVENFASKNKIFLFFSFFKVKPFIFLLEKNFPSMVKGIDLSDLILKLLFFDTKTLILGSLDAKTL